MASADGTVADIEFRGRYGRQVLLRHADGWLTRYAHLRTVRVRMGQQVRAGETIGTVGQTGNATGPHLHFEILTPEKRPVDPAPYLFHK
jgi:murein DD-endopeptidase MepM/ murein hydrolase activator NlpD